MFGAIRIIEYMCFSVFCAIRLIEYACFFRVLGDPSYRIHVFFSEFWAIRFVEYTCFSVLCAIRLIEMRVFAKLRLVRAIRFLQDSKVSSRSAAELHAAVPPSAPRPGSSRRCV